jgi:release factor glutamine methyltransferase
MAADIVGRLRAAGCVFAEDEARLLAEAGTPEVVEQLVARRVAGEPIEQLLGWVEFCGLRIELAPGVFVPRRRTEFLVECAADAARPGDVVVDLCCGSGAVGAALRAAVPGVELHAADVDPEAVRCARHNLGARVHQGDLYAALPDALRGRVAVLVANAPYVPTEAIATMPPEARLYEPRTALDGGGDGLDLLRRIVAGAPDWLAPGGALFLESSVPQSAVLVDLMTAAGLDAAVRIARTFAGTIVAGTAPAA